MKSDSAYHSLNWIAFRDLFDSRASITRQRLAYCIEGCSSSDAQQVLRGCGLERILMNNVCGNSVMTYTNLDHTPRLRCVLPLYMQYMKSFNAFERISKWTSDLCYVLNMTILSWKYKEREIWRNFHSCDEADKRKYITAHELRKFKSSMQLALVLLYNWLMTSGEHNYCQAGKLPGLEDLAIQSFSSTILEPFKNNIWSVLVSKLEILRWTTKIKSDPNC